MNTNFLPRKQKPVALALAALLLATTASAWASELSNLDSVRIQRIKLINGMLAHGAVTPEKADEMIREVNRRTAETKEALLSGTPIDTAAALQPSSSLATATAAPGVVVAAAATTAVVTDAMKSEMRDQIKRELAAEMKTQMADDIKRQVLAELTGATSGSAGMAIAQAGGPESAVIDPATGKPKPRVVRVPYVPESMRREIREQLKTEVLAQAKEERWGNPSTLPEWLDRFQFEGDMRLRYDSFMLDKGNMKAGQTGNVSGAYLTRGADLVQNLFSSAGLGLPDPGVNTQQDFNRARLRARFGANIKVSDTVSAGFRIATGNITGPTSTNQTLGQGFNKYTLVLDRGFITLKPIPWLSLTGGRIANPFMSTDLVWADDLNFEGVAATYAPMITPEIDVFATAGWFPLRSDNPLQTSSRSLIGLQGGVKWKATPVTDFKLAGAIYDYNGIEGKLDNRFSATTPIPSDYGTRYEYPQGLRQRGNTLFAVNGLQDCVPLTNCSGSTYWGLASGFREFNLTGSLDISRFDPVHIVLTGDFVKNLAFSRNKMAKTTGSSIIDGKDYGYLGKILVGQPSMARSGDWNVSLAYRWLGSDAVLDAFTNSDFGLGGTNNKGFVFGGNYGIDKNAWVSARWMSSDLIDSMAPAVGPATVPSKLAVDLLQIDLNAKF